MLQLIEDAALSMPGRFETVTFVSLVSSAQSYGRGQGLTVPQHGVGDFLCVDAFREPQMGLGSPLYCLGTLGLRPNRHWLRQGTLSTSARPFMHPAVQLEACNRDDQGFCNTLRRRSSALADAFCNRGPPTAEGCMTAPHPRPGRCHLVLMDWVRVLFKRHDHPLWAGVQRAQQGGVNVQLVLTGV